MEGRLILSCVVLFTQASRPKIVSVSMCLDLIRRDVKFEPNGKVVAKVVTISAVLCV